MSIHTHMYLYTILRKHHILDKTNIAQSYTNENVRLQYNIVRFDQDAGKIAKRDDRRNFPEGQNGKIITVRAYPEGSRAGMENLCKCVKRISECVEAMTAVLG
jgi:hypothetical protein